MLSVRRSDRLRRIVEHSAYLEWLPSKLAVLVITTALIICHSDMLVGSVMGLPANVIGAR